jgi:parvulin-like peptidyl-prolyl isomerase
VTLEQSSEDFFDLSKPHVRRSMALLALGALLGLAVAGYGLFTAKGTRSRSVPPEDVALVNNRPILRSDFMTQVQTELAAPFTQSMPEQRAKTLQDMVAEELQVQRGLELDLPSFDPDVRTALVAGVQLEATADVLAQQPTDQELRAYYEAHKDRYIGEGVLRMRDLVAKSGAATAAEQVMANAQRAVTALRAGMPVEQAVQRYQLEDSGALMAAGHVDTDEIFEFAARAKLAREIYAASATLHDGQVSDPIRQSDGVHVVVMLQHRMPVREDYATAADQVWTDYKNEAQARMRETNVRYLRNRADILLSPEVRAFEERAR